MKELEEIIYDDLVNFINDNQLTIPNEKYKISMGYCSDFKKNIQLNYFK